MKAMLVMLKDLFLFLSLPFLRVRGLVSSASPSSPAVSSFAGTSGSVYRDAPQLIGAAHAG
jgi:hypothetical protein